MRDLLEQVIATDEILGPGVPEPADNLLDLFAHRREEPRAVLRCTADLLRGELLQPVRLSHGDALDLSRNPNVAGVELAAAADRAAQRDHRQGPKGDSVGPHAKQLHNVVGVAVAAVGPDLDSIANPGLHQGLVDGTRADVGRQPNVAQCMLAGRAGATLEAREGDDVGACLGDPEPDRADVGHHRHLDRDPEIGIDRLQLVDQLGQVLDGVQIVIVRGRDQVGAGGRVARVGHLLGDLLRRQVTAFARLCALAYLDLGEVGGIQHLCRDTEPAGGNLLAAPLAVLAKHVRDLPTLPVDAEDVDRLRRVGIGAKRRLGLGAEAHRADNHRVVVVPHARVDVLWIDRVPVTPQAHDVAH